MVPGNPYYNSPHPSVQRESKVWMIQWRYLSSNSFFLLCVVIKRKKTQTAHSHNINNPDSPWSSQEVRRLLHHLLSSPNSWQPLQAPRPVVPALLYS